MGACFKNKIADRIFSNSNCDLQIFCHINLDILNKLVPCKKSTVNQMPFITKMLSKAMERTLQNNFLETKLRKTKFSIQRHYCLSFEKKLKDYKNLNEKNLFENKVFWKPANLAMCVIVRDRMLLDRERWRFLNWIRNGWSSE